MTDYDYILNDLMRIRDIVYIQKIAYDAWNATQFVINAEEKGFPMEPFSQALGNFNRPTKEMERLILSGRAVIDNNLINRHCFRMLLWQEIKMVTPSLPSSLRKRRSME